MTTTKAHRHVDFSASVLERRRRRQRHESARALRRGVRERVAAGLR